MNTKFEAAKLAADKLSALFKGRHPIAILSEADSFLLEVRVKDGVELQGLPSEVDGFKVRQGVYTPAFAC